MGLIKQMSEAISIMQVDITRGHFTHLIIKTQNTGKPDRNRP
jgi:hypothetical protein